MDTEKTRLYYENKTRDNVCQCDYCQNFIDEVKGVYPEIAEYLSSLGVDIEIPFEVFLPIETEDDYMDYYGVQYLIAGNNEGFQGTEIGDISVRIAACHPDAAYKGEYFVIELGTFHIKCRFDKYKFK